MSYEFKKLSDVEAVTEPAETANVLIEEDGVIKKAPKTAVGGNGEWDAVIDLGDGCYTDSLDAATFTLVSGSFSDLANKLRNGEAPRVLLKRVFEYGDIFYEYYTPSDIYLCGNSYVGIAQAVKDDIGYVGFMRVKILSDGSFLFDYSSK